MYPEDSIKEFIKNIVNEFDMAVDYESIIGKPCLIISMFKCDTIHIYVSNGIVYSELDVLTEDVLKKCVCSAEMASNIFKKIMDAAPSFGSGDSADE